jgi:C4-dicarboxylate transporter DctM subunit
LLIVVVMGGIYTGMFTPTEAAAMSAVYAFFVAVFVYKDMGLKDVPRVLLDSANMSAMLLYIITNAVLFSFLMTTRTSRRPWPSGCWPPGLGVIGFLLAVNILLLHAGNFMEPSSIVLILAPILFPIAMKLGIDPVHFGIMITVNMEVGMITRRSGSISTWLQRHHQAGLTDTDRRCWPMAAHHAGVPLPSSPTGRRCRFGCPHSQAVMTWKLLRARIVKHSAGPLNAKGGDVAMEELVLAYERLEME